MSFKDCLILLKGICSLLKFQGRHFMWKVKGGFVKRKFKVALPKEKMTFLYKRRSFPKEASWNWPLFMYKEEYTVGQKTLHIWGCLYPNKWLPISNGDIKQEIEWHSVQGNKNTMNHSIHNSENCISSAYLPPSTR